MANQRKFKGIRYLLEATYHLDDLPDLHILLIGRDMDEGHLKQLITLSPIRRHIHLTGWRNDVLSILASCDAFVLPSIGGEAITKSLIEAMSMGLAPIITDIPGNRDLVSDGVHGIVVPSKDPKSIASAIRVLYNDHEKTGIYGLASQKHIEENFRSSDTIEATYALFTDLLR